MAVKDLMSRDVQTIPGDALVITAACAMRDHDIGFLPVVEGERLVGTLTDRDIVLRCIAESHNPGATRVRDIMSLEVVCCLEDEEVAAAEEQMSVHGLRRMPVIDAGQRLVGVVTLPGMRGMEVPHKTAVKVTFEKEKTDAQGRPRGVAVKTVYVTGRSDKSGAEAAAVRHVEEERKASWTGVADTIRSEPAAPGEKGGRTG